MILEYIERWHEARKHIKIDSIQLIFGVQLLGDEKYEAAAIYAANSPKVQNIDELKINNLLLIIKGVLRNSETLDSFKNVKHSLGLKQALCAKRNDGQSSLLLLRSPLLTYCEILLSTVTDATMRPSKADSVECVRCALKHGRMRKLKEGGENTQTISDLGKIDLVAHWLATDVVSS